MVVPQVAAAAVHIYIGLRYNLLTADGPAGDVRALPGAERVALLATDGGSWLAEPGRWQGVGQSGKVYDVPGARLVRDDDASAPARLEGTAEAMARWLWGRGPEPAASGSGAALAALREARDQGMQ